MTASARGIGHELGTPEQHCSILTTILAAVGVKVFAAPPADLTTISVQVPLFGTITDVPLV